MPAVNHGQLSLDWQTLRASDMPVKVIQVGTTTTSFQAR
jgi:hypothetical protein